MRDLCGIGQLGGQRLCRAAGKSRASDREPFARLDDIHPFAAQRVRHHATDGHLGLGSVDALEHEIRILDGVAQLFRRIYPQLGMKRIRQLLSFGGNVVDGAWHNQFRNTDRGVDDRIRVFGEYLFEHLLCAVEHHAYGDFVQLGRLAVYRMHNFVKAHRAVQLYADKPRHLVRRSRLVPYDAVFDDILLGFGTFHDQTSFTATSREASATLCSRERPARVATSSM